MPSSMLLNSRLVSSKRSSAVAARALQLCISELCCAACCLLRCHAALLLRACCRSASQRCPGSAITARVQRHGMPSARCIHQMHPAVHACTRLRACTHSHGKSQWTVPMSCALAAFHFSAALKGMCGAVWWMTVNVLIQKW